MTIFSKDERGFTLIELTVIIAIIGIMSAVLIASLSSNKSVARLKTAQREVASTIKLAQTYALQGKTQEYPAGSGTFITPCGYGFRFLPDNETYQIYYNLAGTAPGDYADCNERKADPTGRHYVFGDPKGSHDLESYQLGNGVALSSPPSNRAEVYFTVPHSDANDYRGDEFLPDPPASPLADLVLTLNFSGSTKTVTFKAGGSVIESQ